jgi:cation:H+ antiporter
MSIDAAIALAAGAVFLIVGAELLVRGAARLATRVGMSPLVVGLTVVAYGTSSPELAVSLLSSLAGQGDVAIGNVVGSNIFNVLFILGVSAMITPLVVAQQLVRWDVPLMIGVSVLLLVLAQDGVIGTFDGALLFAGMVAYTGFAVRASRRETAQIVQEYEQELEHRSVGGGVARQIGYIALGLVLLVLGSRWLVLSAVELARAFGVSELVIGLTIIAAGTSLPEVATSIIASVRGERDIAVGNVVGSNLFNILAVLGVCGLAAAGGVPVSPAALRFDLPVMVAVAIACLPIFFTGWRIARWEGFVFVGYYVAYTSYLVMQAAHHDALPAYSAVMMLFVLPLTAVTLVVLALRAARS